MRRRALRLRSTGDTTQIVTVHYQTNAGTALDGQDYTGVSGTLTFNPGETSKVIPVDILPDTVQELTEQFSIDLDTPVNAGIVDGNAIGTIPNDDAAPTFSIDNVTQGEGVRRVYHLRLLRNQDGRDGPAFLGRFHDAGGNGNGRRGMRPGCRLRDEERHAELCGGGYVANGAGQRLRRYGGRAG